MVTASELVEHSRILAGLAKTVGQEAAALGITAPAVSLHLWAASRQLTNDARVLAYLATDPTEAEAS